MLNKKGERTLAEMQEEVKERLEDKLVENAFCRLYTRGGINLKKVIRGKEKGEGDGRRN